MRVAWTGSADDALAIVTAGDRDRWLQPLADGVPFLTLVPHINREFLHHAAEVMLLRDLYRETVLNGTAAR